MTTGTPRRSVLLIGKSQRVLDDTAAGLRELGCTTQATNDFSSDITGQFDVARTDLVALGGAVPPDRKAELKAQIGAINPRVTFLEGLAGILDRRLARGDHAIPVPGHIPPQAAALSGPPPAAWFATVQIDESVHAFRVAAAL